MVRLEQELGQEKEKGLAGLSQEQLGRMRQINSFLEHNLRYSPASSCLVRHQQSLPTLFHPTLLARENGEMLASLGKLQEEKQEIRAVNWSLR